MNLLKTVTLLILILLRTSAGAQAQDRDKPVSRTPVRDASEARSRLFTLPEHDTNFYFRADLPGDAFVTIQFNRLSYWQEGTLPDMVATANAAWQSVKDSFASATSARRLAVHLPPSGYPAVAAIREWGAEEPTLLLSSGRSQPVRLAVDSIVILKSGVASGRDTAATQIAYTFLLKDMSEIESLAANTELVANLSQTFDSLVAATRALWKKPDASFHQLEAQYDVHKGIYRSPTLRINRRGSILDRFEYNGEFGGSFVAGDMAITSALRLSYYLPPSPGETGQRFVALSSSSLAFTYVESDKLRIRGLVFLNAEFGSLFSGRESPIPLYRTSIGVGYRITSQNAGPYDLRYRLFFNYSLSKAITIMPELYLTSRKVQEDNNQLFYGIGLSIRLF